MLDPNAAIISEKTHETKFYFEDMQFSNNPRSLYIICSFTICNALEHNSTCDQSCDTQKHGGHHRSRTITLAAAPLEANDETDNIISKPIREDVGKYHTNTNKSIVSIQLSWARSSHKLS